MPSLRGLVHASQLVIQFHESRGKLVKEDDPLAKPSLSSPILRTNNYFFHLYYHSQKRLSLCMTMSMLGVKKHLNKDRNVSYLSEVFQTVQSEYYLPKEKH